MPFCQVIVDINHTDVDHVFTYRVPAGLDVCPGMRVHVPFGPRKLEGVVVEMAADCDLPPERVKDICDTLEDYPAVLPPLLELAKEIQRTSFCTLAVALRLMFPAQMRGQRIREKQQEVAVLTVAPDVLGQVIAAQVRAPKRAKVLRALADAPDMELTTAALRETVGDCRDALNALCKMGFVKLEKRESLRRPYGEMERLSAQDPELTRQQEDVLAELLPAVETGKGEFLLYGVTGSGKTEVFIRAVRRAAQMGKTAIVLVPEIALTPQMVSWFRSRFGEDAAVLHSRLSPGERYDEWRRIRRGDVRVVIGARSAIFAPLQNVGLIIIDEEHEQSYIADNNPHYDARQLAHERCAREGAALLLASWIAGKLAEPAARWLEPILSEKLEQRLTAQGNTDDAGEMLAAFGFEGDTLSELVDNAVEKAQQAGETLLSAVVSTALKSAAYAVVYVVSFLLLLLLLRLILTPLHLFTKLPVVHGVNALLGGVLGLVKCALLLFLAVWVLQKLQLLVTPELVSKTVLLKFFAQNSPIDLIAKL